MSRIRRLGKLARFGGLLLISICGLLLVGLVLFERGKNHGFETMRDDVGSFAAAARVYRPLVILLIIGLWDQLLSVCQRLKLLTPQKADFGRYIWLDLTVMLAAIEIALGQDLPLVGFAIGCAFIIARKTRWPKPAFEDWRQSS